MKKPFYQQVLLWVSFFLFGLLALGTLLDAISNAISLITLPIAIASTGIILATWIIIEFIAKLRGIRWVTRGGNAFIVTKLGIKPRLALFGVISLFWLPIAVAQFRTPVAEKDSPVAQTLAGTVFKRMGETIEPLPGVTLRLRGYDETAVTNEHGEFAFQEIMAPREQTVELIAGKAGYKTVTTPATLGNTGQDFIMNETAAGGE